MAKHFSLQLLLLSALITAANLHPISAADTPPSSRATMPPSNHPPLCPSKPSKPRHRQRNLEPRRNKGITSTDVPLEATFFVPNNNAILNPGGVDFGPSAILYHIVPQRLTFSDLKKLPLKARLPTLLPNKYIVITSNSPSNFTVDDSQIVLPDSFSNAAFVIHSVGKILDSSVYGGDGILLPPPENNTTPSRPPLRKTPEHSPEMTSGGHKYYHCNGFLMVFLTLRYALLPKIVPVITRFY